MFLELKQSMILLYLDLGKKVTLKYLSEDCRKIFKNVGPYCIFEEIDPTYKVARDI